MQDLIPSPAIDLGFRRIFTLEQVASVCGVDYDTAYGWFDAWDLKGWQAVGSDSVRVPREYLVKFMAHQNLLPKGITMNDLVPAPQESRKELFELQKQRSQILSANSLLPDHLRGKNADESIANCMMVVEVADRWQMDPFAVAAKTYAIKGRLGFEGMLVAGVVNARANLAEKLNYIFSGEGDELKVIVTGRFKGEAALRAINYTVAQGKAESPTYKAKPKESMWTTDPEQKLCYTGAIRWGRRHCPELLLGVLTPEELGTLPDISEVSQEIPAVDQEQLALEIHEAQEKAKPERSKDVVVELDVETRRKEAVKFFAKEGISPSDILRVFGLSQMTELTEDNLELLREAAAEIKHGNMSAKQALDAIADPEGPIKAKADA